MVRHGSATPLSPVQIRQTFLKRTEEVLFFLIVVVIMKVCRNEIPEKPIIIKAANTYPVIFGNNMGIETGSAFMQIHKKVAGRYLKVNITAFFTVYFKVVLY